MKKLLLIFAVVLFTAGFATKVSAQFVTESNQAGGEIITPITLNAVNELEFGRFATGTIGGTVELTPAPTTTVTPSTTDITKVAGGAPRTAASYTVTGAAGHYYTIGLPTEAVTLDGSNGGTMTVTYFTSYSVNGAVATVGLLTGGSDTFYVGGTLNINGSQTEGLYSGSFDVTVQYN